MVSHHLPLTSLPPTVHVCPSSGLPEYPGAHLSHTRKGNVLGKYLGKRRIQGIWKQWYKGAVKGEVCKRWYSRSGLSNTVMVGTRSPGMDHMSSLPLQRILIDSKTENHQVIKTSNTSSLHHSLQWATVHLLNIHLTKVHPAYLPTTDSFPTGREKTDHKTLLELKMVEAETALKYSTFHRCWFHLLQELDSVENWGPAFTQEETHSHQTAREIPQSKKDSKKTPQSCRGERKQPPEKDALRCKGRKAVIEVIRHKAKLAVPPSPGARAKLNHTSMKGSCVLPHLSSGGSAGQREFSFVNHIQTKGRHYSIFKKMPV